VVIVRTAGDPRAVIGPVRAAVAAMDRNLPIAGITTLQEQLDLSTLPARAAGILLGAFGLLGLILAAVGLYGVMAYSVQQRTHEIGIRMALGARASDVLQLVVGRGLSLTLVGLGLGLALALPLSRLVAGFLYGLSPNDPVTLAAVVALLGAVALGAAYLPARRAAHISPSDALRIE
jgi:putative ABC transport system permease protein